MSSTTPTKNQMNFVGKLIDEYPERSKVMDKFLDSTGKGSLEELSVQEASKLIDELIKITPVNADGTIHVPLATGKQISFLTNLQNSEERIMMTRDYLASKEKTSINLLSMTEASELIDSLRTIATPKGEEAGLSPVTPKQVKFILNLQNTEDKKKIAALYLKKLGKQSVDELTRKEASSLIDMLR